MVDAIEGVCRAIEEEERICLGEFGREALEIAIGFNGRVDLPLADWALRMG